MRLINNSERAIVIGQTVFVPTEPIDVEDDLLNHPRVKELLRLRDLSKVEVEEVT